MKANSDIFLRLQTHLLQQNCPSRYLKNWIVFQAILTALAINCPPNPEEFILQKLQILLTDEDLFEDLRW